MKALGKGSIASIVQIGLSIAWWIVLVTLVAWSLAALSYLVFMIMAGLGVIDPSSVPPVDRSEDSGVQIQISGVDPEAFANLKWTDWQIIAPALVGGAIYIGGSLIVIGRLRRLFDSFSGGEPFRHENAQHLRVIWMTMVAIELARFFVVALIGILLGVFGKPAFMSGFSFSIDTNDFSSWMSILILIVLAEVFREGARLKQEQELTI